MAEVPTSALKGKPFRFAREALLGTCGDNSLDCSSAGTADMLRHGRRHRISNQPQRKRFPVEHRGNRGCNGLLFRFAVEDVGSYALSSDGTLRWAFEPGRDFYSVSIADDGTVYALADGALFALAADGAQKWNYSFDKSKYFSGELAIGPDRNIYLALNQPGVNSSLLAITTEGLLKWRDNSYILLGGPLVASDGSIYQEVRDPNMVYNTQVVALNSDGKGKWTTPMGSKPLAVGSDGTLYICYIRDLFAISPRGNMLWKAQLPEDPSSTTYHVPTKAVTLAPNGEFYIGDFLGKLGTLDAPKRMAASGWPARFHDARNTSRAGAN
jgi:hypothetical protein